MTRSRASLPALIMSALLCVILPCLASGCKTTSADAIASEAALIRLGTSLGVSQGLAALARSKPADEAAIRKGVAEASGVLRGTILPMLAGQPVTAWSGDLVARSFALAEGKLPESARPVVAGLVAAGLARAGVANDPAARLSPQSRAFTVAVFQGLADGADAFLSQ